MGIELFDGFDVRWEMIAGLPLRPLANAGLEHGKVEAAVRPRTYMEPAEECGQKRLQAAGGAEANEGLDAVKGQMRETEAVRLEDRQLAPPPQQGSAARPRQGRGSGHALPS